MSRLMDIFTPITGFGDVDQLIESAMERYPQYVTESAYPPVNVWEKEDKAFVEVELPGLTSDQLDISITGSELTLKGERKAPQADQGLWGRQERSYGRFARIIDLPWEIDPASVEAKLSDGVLTISLAKSPRSIAKKITVQNR